MPRGDKSAYTDKQKRQAEHIEEGYESRGVPEEAAERRAWATVNKETGGGRRSGSGVGKPTNTAPSRKGGPAGRCDCGVSPGSEAARPLRRRPRQPGKSARRGDPRRSTGKCDRNLTVRFPFQNCTKSHLLVEVAQTRCGTGSLRRQPDL
jgi:plasmid stabilization system protein ParE